MATVEEALGEVEQACPCAGIFLEPNAPVWRGKGSCRSMPHCPCAYPEYRREFGEHPCLWPGHAAAARLVEACFSEAHAKRCECGEDTELYGKVYQARVDPRCAAIRERAKR